MEEKVKDLKTTLNLYSKRHTLCQINKKSNHTYQPVQVILANILGVRLWKLNEFD